MGVDPLTIAIGATVVGIALGAVFGIMALGAVSVSAPRIEDTRASSASLGNTIPIVYGTYRMSGQMVWSAGLKELTERNQGSGGGKGVGGGDSGGGNRYVYYSSFAMAFGEGPATSLLRIWADGKLIYDATGTSEDVNNDKYSFRFRTGASDQAVDPLIAESVNRRLAGLPDVNEGTGPQEQYVTLADMIADVTAAASAGDARAAIYQTYMTARQSEVAGSGTPPDYRFTPAYRDLVLLVFEDMPLEDFGNRVPNITAEFTYTTNSVNTNDDIECTLSETAITQINSGAPSEFAAVDLVTRRAYAINGGNIRRFSLTTNSEDGSATAGSISKFLGVDRDTNVVGINSSSIVKLSGNSLTQIGAALALSGTLSYGSTISRSSASSTAVEYLVSNSSGDLFLVNLFDMSLVVTESGVLNGAGPIVQGEKTEFIGTAYTAYDDGSGFELAKIETSYPSVNEIDVTILATVATSEVFRNVLFDSVGEYIYIFTKNSAGDDGFVYQYSTAGVQLNKFAVPFAAPPVTSGFHRSTFNGGILFWAYNNDVVRVDLESGSFILYENVLSGNIGTGFQLYITERASLYGWIGSTPYQIKLNRSTAGSVPLADVIYDICIRSGLSADMIDVTGVPSSLEVRGFAIARPSNARKALEQLLSTYFVYGIESDWSVKFQQRSNTVNQVIPEEDLGVVNDVTGAVNWSETRIPDYELPVQMSLTYLDKNRDYQESTAQWQRVSSPVKTMYAVEKETADIPLVMVESEARETVQKMLYYAWLSRDVSKFVLPWRYMALNPGDVIQVTFDDGRILTDRIVQTTTGANFEIEAESARNGDPVFTAGSTSTVASAVAPIQGVIVPVYSRLFLLETPLLYDYHDTGRSSNRWYTAVGSNTTAWRSARIYRSTDGSEFFQYDTATTDVSWGILEEAFNAPDVLFVTDRENTITVRLYVDNGDLNTVTRQQLFDNPGLNRALVGNEILQFQTVTDNGDGTYTLSDLIRYQRGTDYAVGNLPAGTLFILIPDSGILTQTADLSEIASTRYFRAVSAGDIISNSVIENITFDGISLKPYAIRHATVTQDGTDLDITWVRRTRVGGDWSNGTSDVVPLAEDTEEYEIYILPDTGTNFADFDPTNASTYLRTATTTTTEFVYTAAMQATDGYTGGDTLYFVIYQISAQVGRGFKGEFTVLDANIL